MVRIARASPQAQFIAPWPVHNRLKEIGILRALPLPETGRMQALNGVRFTAVPAAHYGLDQDVKRGFPYFGYVIESGEVRIYHAGGLSSTRYAGAPGTLCPAGSGAAAGLTGGLLAGTVGDDRQPECGGGGEMQHACRPKCSFRCTMTFLLPTTSRWQRWFSAWKKITRASAGTGFSQGKFTSSWLTKKNGSAGKAEPVIFPEV